jgi:oligopeptide/dipeptide ABC transporter ATP-binding protein
MEALIETRNLKTYFPILKGTWRRTVGTVKAVDGINLVIGRGQWLGVVGESGCGKTTLAKTVIRLLQPTSGNIYFDTPSHVKEEIDTLASAGNNPQKLMKLRREHDIAAFSDKRLQMIRRKLQLVHQDPYTSLNPRMKIRSIVAEPIIVNKLLSGKQVNERATEILQMVGLSSSQLLRYPHQFSGGQRQRVAIARALATNPDVIIFDEPTSALDVSVQAQILSLLRRLKEDYNLTYLYITHNLTVAESVCSLIAVMYLGKIVELGNPIDIFRHPMHPYSLALIQATPIADPTRKRSYIALPGEVPSPSNPPPGCRFHPRCSRATEQCKEMEPPFKSVNGGRWISCWHTMG